MRKDATKAGPSGMSRNNAFGLYESWGGRNCLLPIANCEPIKDMMDILGGSSLLDFVPPDYAQRAEAALEQLGITEIIMGNVWEIFRDLLDVISSSFFFAPKFRSTKFAELFPPLSSRFSVCLLL